MDWTRFAEEELVRLAQPILGSAAPGLWPDDARRACAGFRVRDVCVLGGDLYVSDGSRMRPTQGWAVDREPGELWLDYRDRSLRLALRQIDRIGDAVSEGQALIVLVCSTERETDKNVHGR